MEQPIIQPISKELLKSELTPDKQLRMTNKSNNEIYIITAHNAPNVMREIGRLREIVFREAGGGTGKEVDIDEFDICENCYKQLIVWNPEEEEIIGGYRYLAGTDWDYDEKGQPILATSHMFSEKFIKEYAPQTVELGRSFVSLPYQSSRMGAKSLFALDNLWDGLGALTVLRPNVRYYFGKMTMYPSYIRKGRDMILYFLKKYFDDKENLIIPMKPLELETDLAELDALFCGQSFKEDYLVLNREIRKLGYNIPPLVNAYMGLSPTMKLFGTAINYGFGDVEETGILIAIDEIFESKRKRHIDTFIAEFLLLWAFLPAVALAQSLDSLHIMIDAETNSNVPHVYKTFQEAAAHFKNGSSASPMTVYIRPGVYWIDDPDDPTVKVGKDRQVPFGMTVRCAYLHLPISISLEWVKILRMWCSPPNEVRCREQWVISPCSTSGSRRYGWRI